MIEVFTDEELLRSMRVCLKAWARARPQEFEATKQYMVKLRDGQVNHHGVAGLSKEGGILHWGIIPGSVYNLIAQYVGKGWDSDNRYLNAFFTEFKLGCVNESTKANVQRSK